MPFFNPKSIFNKIGGRKNPGGYQLSLFLVTYVQVQSWNTKTTYLRDATLQIRKSFLKRLFTKNVLMIFLGPCIPYQGVVLLHFLGENFQKIGRFLPPENITWFYRIFCPKFHNLSENKESALDILSLTWAADADLDRLVYYWRARFQLEWVSLIRIVRLGIKIIEEILT